ncbi:polymer-forming cytoskeletal protein [bacterium]|nr:polymer-forming cytoskeletal protein [bacterium]
MIKKTILILIAILHVGLNLNAVVLKHEADELIESGQYEEDYLFVGNRLEFSGKAKDLFAFGETIDFSGTTTLAITTAAKLIGVSGSIGNGIKAAGQTITIEGKTTGTSFLAGDTILFGQKSQIDGDTLVGARKVTIKGKMIGDLYAGVGELSVQNEIQGNVNVYAGELTIPEPGRITGNLIYHSEHELRAEEAARVAGKITFEKTESSESFDRFNEGFFSVSFWFELFFKISFIIIGLLMLLLPATKAMEKRQTHKEVFSQSLWGLIPIFVYPSAIVISMVLVITIPLGIALLLAFFPIILTTKILGITLIGNLISNQLSLNINSRYLFFLIAAILYSALSFIPYLGFLLMLIVSSIGCGWITFSLFQKR